MAVDITIPSPGESVSEVTIGSWLKKDGDWVEQDETIVELESDKATLEVPAPAAGVLSVKAEEGEEKEVGDVIGAIDDSAEKPEDGDGKEKKSEDKDESGEKQDKEAKKKEDEEKEEKKQRKQEATAKADEDAKEDKKKREDKEEEEAEEEAAPSETARANETATKIAAASGDGQRRATSLARKIAADRGVDLAGVSGTGPAGRITKSDVLAASEEGHEQPDRSKTVPALAEQQVSVPAETGRGVRREKMTKLRRRIAERLVQAQHNAAMLTTFNECDMSEVIRLRKRHKETFQEQHGVGLGFMSFFVKAAASALTEFPRVNAYITGEEIEYHDFIDISIAVGTDRGLVVPVLRDVQDMSFADIELAIKDFATRARDGKLTIDEMTGGTFTISNGGVYGSLNSTPILNPPQSGILGMHAIKNRPVEDPDNEGQLVLRPMMHLAMSYDHRIIDGAEAVGFLVHIKDHIESPERMLLGV